MRLVALSDTHGYHNNLDVPDGDVLIFAGDFSMRAKIKHVVEFAQWIKSLPHKHKIVVPGNHDCAVESKGAWAIDEFKPAHLLLHNTCEVDGVKIFGSPYSSSIYEPSIWSFDYPRFGQRGKDLWGAIPEDIDILVTHGPPKGMRDQVLNMHPGEDPHVGDETLMDMVNLVRPKVHFFGHIHESHGTQVGDNGTIFCNVCVCDLGYKPNNPITVIDI